MLRNGFDIPHDYKSPFRPAQLKQYKKAPSLSVGQKVEKRPSNEKPNVGPTVLEKRAFE